MDVWSVSVKSTAIPFEIIFEFIFADKIHYIKSETLDTFAHPKTYNLLNLFTHLGVIPVQIRLLYME